MPMPGAILYPTYDDCKVLNEAILKYGYWPDYNPVNNKIDYGDADEISPMIVVCAILATAAIESIYPPLKINETVLG